MCLVVAYVSDGANEKLGRHRHAFVDLVGYESVDAERLDRGERAERADVVIGTVEFVARFLLEAFEDLGVRL